MTVIQSWQSDSLAVLTVGLAVTVIRNRRRRRREKRSKSRRRRRRRRRRRMRRPLQTCLFLSVN